MRATPHPHRDPGRDPGRDGASAAGRRRLLAGLGLACWTVVAAVTVAAAPAALADPVRVFAAGSLAEPMKAIIAASGVPAADVATPVFGPAGLLRQRIEGGEGADLFASADLAQPQRLAEKGAFLPPVPFARNRMCVLGKPALGLTADGVLETLLSAQTRLATSTPGNDPGGDYALAVFDRADRLHPGAGQILRDKAQRLLGAPNAMLPVSGKSPVASIFLGDRADALLYYCSSVPATLQQVPGLVAVPLPASLDPGPVYGLTVLGKSPQAMQLALFIVSEQGQGILARYGLLPLAPPATAATTATRPARAEVPLDRIEIAGPNGTVRSVSAETLRGLPSVPLQVSFATEHGQREASFEGPSLWDVLAQAGAVDASRPREQVRQVVTLEGRDGYTATLALGEIAPAFEGKQVILAERMNGQDLEAGHLRVVLPTDRFGGRSVRDIARITITTGAP